jgi:hypothetical protein
MLVAGSASLALASQLLAVRARPPAPAAVPRYARAAAVAAAEPLLEVFHERIRMLIEKRAYEAFQLPTYDAQAG